MSDAAAPATASGRAAWLAATWCGVGLLPRAPGTFGTLAAVPLVAALWWIGPGAVALAAIAVTAVGVAAAGAVVRHQREKDPGHVVIDEVAGYLVACSFCAPGWRSATLAFVLFRVLDIWKPGPVQRLESLPGGWGVMADDLGAGVVAGLLTWLSFGLAAGQWAGPFA